MLEFGYIEQGLLLVLFCSFCSVHTRCKAKFKKNVSRPDFYKKESGRAVFLLFIISYCMLSLHIITFPQGYVGALR